MVPGSRAPDFALRGFKRVVLQPGVVVAIAGGVAEDAEGRAFLHGEDQGHAGRVVQFLPGAARPAVRAVPDRARLRRPVRRRIAWAKRRRARPGRDVPPWPGFFSSTSLHSLPAGHKPDQFDRLPRVALMLAGQQRPIGLPPQDQAVRIGPEILGRPVGRLPGLDVHAEVRPADPDPLRAGLDDVHEAVPLLASPLVEQFRPAVVPLEELEADARAAGQLEPGAVALPRGRTRSGRESPSRR